MKKRVVLPVLVLLGMIFSQGVNAQGVWKSLSEVSYRISKDNF